MREKENFILKNIGTKYYIEVIGELDEDVNLKNMKMPNAVEIVINFEGVTRIQSCGIREWIQMIHPCTKALIIYQNCPKIIVDQMNMLEGFLPKGGRVDSFYVPYYSEELGSEKSILFRRGVEFDERGIYLPDEVKDESGNVLQLDVIEEKYFKFLSHK